MSASQRHVWQRPPAGVFLVCERCNTVWMPDQRERDLGACPVPPSNQGDKT